MNLGTVTVGDYFELPPVPVSITGSTDGLQVRVKVWSGDPLDPEWEILKSLDSAGIEYTDGEVLAAIHEADWPEEALTMTRLARCKVEYEVRVTAIPGPVSSVWHELDVRRQGIL